MFMEKLLQETQRLSVIVSMLEIMKQSDSNIEARGWNTPIGMAKITGSCLKIGELSGAIIDAGYRECDKPTLDGIMSETRQVLNTLLTQAPA